jgi:para-aminobenzoate synthetase / 4-amino-4-deoxychorismate lyase
VGSDCAELPSACYSLLASEPDSVLLQTSRFDQQNHRSYLFVRPLRVVAIEKLADLPALFAEIERCLEQGLFAAGFLSYECGYHFQDLAYLADRQGELPLAWIGIYEQPLMFDHHAGALEEERRIAAGEGARSSNVSGVSECSPGEAPGPTNADMYGIGEMHLVAEEEYRSQVQVIKDYISAGDTYQVNFTHPLSFPFSGSPMALFQALRRQQSVSYNAFIRCGEDHILSFSPELFFRTSAGHIITRPMKGTAHRGKDVGEDLRLAHWLHTDLKNRAENVMIVDLLRNDLGRICRFGSIRTEELFAVEKYETLFQMTSTISGELKPDISYYDIFRSLFPCGSVTGAPKIRTMQIIRELETRPRGVYTGAIGFFSPRGEAVFNVPIRTIVLRSERGEMGVGSGIVADSSAPDEYRECLLKTEFLTRRVEPFRLIETILWDCDYALLPRHVQRLRCSAEYFDFRLDREAITEQLKRNGSLLQPGTRYKVRLLLDHAGAITVENVALSDERGAGEVLLSSRRTDSSDRFLYHKTTHRQLYDALHAEARDQGFLDVIFMNERDEITEGAISNIFVEKDGRLHTPPVSCGLLPGVYRQHVLDTRPEAQEKVLHLDDVLAADALYICNAVRGLRKVMFKTASALAERRVRAGKA